MVQSILSEIKGDILVVDDDLAALELLSKLLADQGNEVRSARDGATALMMAAADPPDMILLDILMPGMNGFQVCEQLKADPATRDIPVIFISARDEVHNKIAGFEVGGVDYILKPYQIEEVLRRIQTHLKLSRLQIVLLRRLSELSALHNISKTLASVHALPEALETICETITDIFSARVAFIALQEEGSAELKGWFGYKRNHGPLSNADRIALPEDLMQPQLLSSAGTSIDIRQVKEIPFSNRVVAFIEENDLQFGLVVPLSFRGSRQGILILARDKNGSAFQQDEINLADTIAKDVSTAIENEYLAEQARLAAAGAAVDAERQRLARELHDSVTQLIYSLTLLSSGWENMARQGTLEDPADSFHRLGLIGQLALREMRLLLHQLRPSVLEESGLVQAIQQRLDAVERRANINTQLVVQGNLDGLPHKIEDELFHISQEILNNSLRHARAETVSVSIEEDQGVVTLRIEDDGIGFDSSAAPRGMGLKNMSERAQAIGGTLTIHSESQHGTRVTVSVDTRERQRNP